MTFFFDFKELSSLHYKKTNNMYINYKFFYSVGNWVPWSQKNISFYTTFDNYFVLICSLLHIFNWYSLHFSTIKYMFKYQFWHMKIYKKWKNPSFLFQNHPKILKSETYLIKLINILLKWEECMQTFNM